MSAVLDFPVKPEARPYLDAFDKSIGTEHEPAWLTRSRRRGLSRFAELGFPTRRSESWRYLDLQPLQLKPLLPAEPHPGKQNTAAQTLLAGLELPGRGPRLVILDGRFAPALSRIGDLPAGVWFGATEAAIAEREDLFREVKGRYPAFRLHALSPPEIIHLSRLSQLPVPGGRLLRET